MNEVQPVRNHDIVKSELVELKRSTRKTWREIAQLEQYSPIPFGTLSSIYNDYPIPKKWFKKLGIIVQESLAPVCPIHGKVCVVDCVTEKTYNLATQEVFPKGTATYDPAVQVVKPAPKPRTRRERISINKRNMASAARTIINNLDANKVCELVAILKEAYR